MTYDLEHLIQARKTILLAEIAGLLHNLGKLDPNFLAPMMKDDAYAKRTVIKRLADIPDYEFQRFAAPDPNLLTEEWSILLDPDAVNLKSKLETAVEDKPGSEKRIKAAETFRAFTRANGPLYRCFSSNRSERLRNWQRALEEMQTIQQEHRQAEQEVARLKEALDALSPEADRSQLGREFNDAINRKRDIDESLAQVKHRLEQVQQDIPAEEHRAQSQLEAKFRKVMLGEHLEPWPLADLLTLFWDDFFYREEPEDEKEDTDHLRRSALKPWLKADQGTKLPALLILSHGYVSGSEKYWSSGTRIDAERPTWKALRAATAFGYDRAELKPWDLQSKRFELIEAALEACADPTGQRATFVDNAREILSLGLGDTQWPINEIDLWDYASSIAALFKSGVARAVLDDAIPSVDAMRWRFLSVRFDGLGYLSQAHHVTDLLGRHDSLDVALDAVQVLLEETYPLGNEVYRDENGAVFVVPAWEDGRSTLTLADDAGTTLETLIAQTFQEATRTKSDKKKSLPAFDGELVPTLKEGESVRGKKLQLGAYLEAREQPLTADLARMASWWTEKQAEGQEICTVCGVRPAGFRPQGVDFPGWVKAKKARERHLCCVCLHRRGRRAEQWLKHESGTTIWADEVVDENGRFALLVAKFDLGQWLDSALIPTMQKPASFARVQRVWETTQALWKEIETEGLLSKLETRTRMQIEPQNSKALRNLGSYHTYELDVSGQRVSVVWVPPVMDKDEDENEKVRIPGYFLTTEYLADLVQRLNIPKDKNDTPFTALQKWMQSKQENRWGIHEPSGYLEPRGDPEATFTAASFNGNDKPYTPYIPLLKEPARFMALVPANRVMDIVAAIREKYEQELSKVQDRLPLHLGLVIAKRRTPLRAVLDAGRALLKRPSSWEAWKVTGRSKGSVLPAHLANDAHFAEWWEVTLKQKHGEQQLTLRVADRMGDGSTEDRWHAHFCTERPGDDKVNPESDVTHVSDLTEGETVYLKPATFDFEYLDTTARRFAIAYDGKGRRLGRASRPYLLNDVETLAEIWRVLNAHLKSSQSMWIHGLIEEKRREWHWVTRSGDRPQQEGDPPQPAPPRGPNAEYTAAFERFVKDTLRRAEWKEKKPPESEDFDLLVKAAIDGTLADVIDLYHEALKIEWKTQT